MKTLTQWVTNNKRTALIGAGILTLVIIGVLAWLTFTTPQGTPPAPDEAGQETTAPTPTQPEEPIEVEDPGPETLPETDVSPQIAAWKVEKLTPIPATTDPVEFTAAFARVWMAPNYSAYTKDTFANWVFEHYAPNRVNAKRANDAEVSIHNQMMPTTEWEVNRRGFDAAFFFVERMSSCRRKSIPLLVSEQCVWCWSITRSIRL